MSRIGSVSISKLTRCYLNKSFAINIRTLADGDKVIPKQKETPKSSSDQDDHDYNMVMKGPESFCTPSDLDKKILVWTGRFKSKEEIPTTIPFSLIDTARSKMRIRISNISILLTLLGCFGMAMAGKKSQREGKTVQQINLDWHASMKDSKE